VAGSSSRLSRQLQETREAGGPEGLSPLVGSSLRCELTQGVLMGVQHARAVEDPLCRVSRCSRRSCETSQRLAHRVPADTALDGGVFSPDERSSASGQQTCLLLGRLRTRSLDRDPAKRSRAVQDGPPGPSAASRAAAPLDGPEKRSYEVPFEHPPATSVAIANASNPRATWAASWAFTDPREQQERRRSRHARESEPEGMRTIVTCTADERLVRDGGDIIAAMYQGSDRRTRVSMQSRDVICLVFDTRGIKRGFDEAKTAVTGLVRDCAASVWAIQAVVYA
jgi:hypothetical protein